LLKPIPPVGTNFILGNGAEIDFIVFNPPYCSAGKNLTTFFT
jgi:methylase of polypeptide subunit release factors